MKNQILSEVYEYRYAITFALALILGFFAGIIVGLNHFN
jgi:hypothetical protein